MSSLLYLSITKIKSRIRNQFRTLTSGLFTIFMVLLYGGLVVLVFATSEAYVPETMRLSANMAVLAGLGMTALLTVTLMMNKRKALVYDTDAYYLFAGPYTRKQVNGFILVQSQLQAVLYGLLGCFMMAMFSMGGHFSLSYFFVAFVVFFLLISFFLLLTDYIYMWTLLKEKMKYWNYVVVFCLVASAAAVFFFAWQKQSFALEEGFMEFALGKEFYLVPFFGWGKWVLNSFLERQYVSAGLGILLLLACEIVMVALFLRFRGDIAEQAVKDAEEFSELLRRAKANRSQIQSSQKIKRVKGSFPQGARAIFHKNMLIMRKTGNFLRRQDVFLIVFYFLISYISMPERRFYMFCYMMVLWLFQLLNDAELLGDLRNYQIYLIPESPLKKLLGAVLPACVKVTVIISASVLFAGLLNQMAIEAILQYWVMLLGYGMIFIAGTVLSVRILKSRSNVMAENFLRMLIVLVAAVPATAVGVLLFIFIRDTGLFMQVMTVVTLFMNIAVSAGILVACQGMMNGREL